jgi:hypothetical protein
VRLRRILRVLGLAIGLAILTVALLAVVLAILATKIAWLSDFW